MSSGSTKVRPHGRATAHAGLARRALAALLALAVALPTPLAPLARALAEPAAAGGAQGAPASPQATSLADADEIRIAVLSDMHYYPLNYVSDCEDYETYVGGDPKMLEESGSIADAAIAMIEADAPDVVLVSGDLTKDGERLGHEQLAERLRGIEESCGAEVFVINGNHDIYNYEDACTFENGRKESAPTTSPDEFRQIYADFGYDGSFDAQYFQNPNHGSGEVAGELSYCVDLGRFTIVAIDSGMYSPDAGTGHDGFEHVTAGRVDPDLLPWLTERVREAEAEGDTVVGLMHHGLVPHFEGEEDVLSEYVVEDWRATATALADAGMRYVFTGHMHANDIAEFTTNSGNHITDLETGSLSSWMSPVRTVTLSKGEPLGDGTSRTHETFTVSTSSVKSIDFTDHTGATTHIDDFKAYTQQKLYPPELLNNMAAGMLRPILAEISEQGLRPWLAENLPGVDVDAMVLSAVRDALAGGMDVELGTGVGRVHVEYRNGGIVLSPSGTAGWALDDVTITDAQVLRIVDGVLAQVEATYIDNPDYLLGEVDRIVTDVSTYGLGSIDGADRALYDLVLVILTGHYAGAENPPAWVGPALASIESGAPVEGLIGMLVDDLMPVVDHVLANTSLDTSVAFSGLWKTAIDAATDDGNLKAALALFGFDDAAIRSLVDGLINEYMSPSFLTGMGGLVGGICRSMLYDTNGADDVIDGEGRTITFDGTAAAPAPSVENGLLPTQVTMSLGPDPVRDRAVSWYTGTQVGSGTLQVATDPSFADVVAEVPADSEEVTKPRTQLNLGLVTTYGTQRATRHTAQVSGLAENSDYYYRVGDKDRGLWCEPVAFTTGAPTDDADTFTFVDVNDSQGMVEQDYDTYLATLAQARATFPGAAFTLHAGDFVDDGANEDYWTWALDDPAGVAQGMAMMPAAGNHEARSDVEGITEPNPIVSHFELANVPGGQDLSSGAYYSYDYKNATFVVLNTNDLGADGGISQAQYDWAYGVLSGSDAQWKVVLLHKSPYSNGPHQSDEDVVAIRAQMDALCATADVDLVLSGHDHVYNRTPDLVRGEEQDVAVETQTYQGTNYETMLNPPGTTFVIAGTAGVKNYVQSPSAEIPSEVALDLSVPVYAGVTIDGDHLYYRAYSVSGGSSSLVDSFAISKAEEETPAWKLVEEQIAALPEQTDVTVGDKAAVETARAAYDQLSVEDKGRVSNYDRLVAAERMIQLLESVAGKRTVTVSNHDDFTNAINDPTVGTIVTQGTIEFDEGGLFDDGDREIYVRRDVVVRGTGELRFCRFHVEGGATLVLADSVYVNDTRSQGSFYDALNPVEVNAGGTLITQDEVSLRTEYGTGGNGDGVAVKLMGAGATAILGSSGTYWGSEAAVLSEASGTTLVINDGTYNAKNSNRVVIDTHGDATVNGGTISSMWISGTLRVTGGTFEHQDSASSNWTPLAVSGGNAYITGGTFKTYGGRDGNASIKLENGARVHVLSSSADDVLIGDAHAYVGSVSTENYRDVRVGYWNANGWGDADGIYRAYDATSAGSVEDLASLGAALMSKGHVSDGGDYMTGTLPSGESTVFGKYWLYGNGKGAPAGSGIIGSGEVIVYGPARTIQNNPVTGVTVEGDATRVVDLRRDGSDTLRLTGYVTPANAFDNALEWSSSDEGVASVEASAGQGVVSIAKAGGTRVTATSVSNRDASAFVDVIAVRPTLVGPDAIDGDSSDFDRTLSAGTGIAQNAPYADRLGFAWSTDNAGIATVDENGRLTMTGSGTVKVTATLCVDGTPTDVVVEKEVVCRAKPSLDAADASRALDVLVTDGAGTHADRTFTELLGNPEGSQDSYVLGEVERVELPSEGLGALGDALGVTEPDYAWRAEVTVKAAPYVAAYDEGLGLEAGSHELAQGEPAERTVVLEWDFRTSSWGLAEGSSSPVAFEVACEPPAPTAPTPEQVAGMAGISVTLEGVNELNGPEGTGAHADVTFSADGDAALLPGSLSVGAPERDASGAWTVEVTLDGQAYLDAYAQMGDPAYGAHYFASPDETGGRTFTLVHDDATGAWGLPQGQAAAYEFDVTCLTLRPVAVEKYVGDDEGGTQHFPEPYVEDGLGSYYTIDELNALLDEGTTARVAYFDGASEISDDTRPGSYTARIVVEAGAPATRAGGQGQSVNVNVGEEDYSFALVDSTLTIRSVSDPSAAERGALDVDLLPADPADEQVEQALSATPGGVVAALPAGSTLTVNGIPEAVLADASGVRLLSDELLAVGTDRERLLLDHAAEQGFDVEGRGYDFRYLDLVDGTRSNAWVSSDKGVDVWWALPEGVTADDDVQVLRFDGLHRTYAPDDANLGGLVAASAVERVEGVQVGEGHVRFHVGPGEFCPMVVTWEQGEPAPATATVALDARGGTLPAGAPASLSVAVGSSVAAGALPTPTLEGHDFAGWYTDEGCADGTEFVAGQTVVQGDLTLYAKWVPVDVSVTFDLAGGTLDGSTEPVVRTVSYGSALGELPVPERDGYTLVGWFTAEEGGDEVDAETVVSSVSPVTYHARWELDEASDAVTLSLDPGEGAFEGLATGEAREVSVVKGRPLASSDLPTPVREGYVVEGWYTDPSFAAGSRVNLSDDAVEGEPTTFDADATLHARWLRDLSGEAALPGLGGVEGVAVTYDGLPHPADPAFGDGFPEADRALVVVEYRPAGAGEDAWAGAAPVDAGTYDARLSYPGSEEAQAFELVAPGAVSIGRAPLSQTGLAADPSEVGKGTPLSEVALGGATVTMADGTPVSGAWAWVEQGVVLTGDGSHLAVFTPDDAANLLPLYAEVPVAVRDASGDGQGAGSDQPGSEGQGGGQPGSGPDQPGPGEQGGGSDQGAGPGASEVAGGAAAPVAIPATSDPGLGDLATVVSAAGAALLAAGSLVGCRGRARRRP